MKNSNQVFWDRAAEENPYYYIATRRKDWKTEDFFRDGEWRVTKWILPWLTMNNLDPKKITFLEVGCGAGRFGVHISKVVKRYIGIDISKRNLELFKENLDSSQNVELILGDGHSLKELSNSCVEVCFSYAVLQHIYERETILSYLRESVRVVAEGGVVKHQLAGSNRTPGFRMRYLRLYTLGDKRLLSRLLKKMLPGDFLIPVPSPYRSGVDFQGEGICYKEAIRYMSSLGISPKVEPFENHNLASKYWLLFSKKDSPLDLDGAYA